MDILLKAKANKIIPFFSAEQLYFTAFQCSEVLLVCVGDHVVNKIKYLFLVVVRNIQTNLGSGPKSGDCNKTNNANTLHSTLPLFYIAICHFAIICHHPDLCHGGSVWNCLP